MTPLKRIGVAVLAVFGFLGIYEFSQEMASGYLRILTYNSTSRVLRTKLAASRWNLLSYGLSRIVLIENMSMDEADLLYFRYVEHEDIKCENHTRLGRLTDGGWDVCTAGPYALRKPCLVYSFGINWDFSFDDAVSKQYGCTVRSFDPSMKKANTYQRDANIWFYKIGLGPVDTFVPSRQWTVKTLESITKMLNDSEKIIDYLKIDIEWDEWASLEQIYGCDILTRVKQFGLEIHAYKTANAFYGHWKILKRLETFGFRRWYYHKNHFGFYKYGNYNRTCCHELVYINENFLLSI